MLLPKTKEPTEIKERFEADLHRHSDWSRDWLAAWHGNKVPAHLWSKCGWKESLKAEGISWQRFQTLCSYFNNQVKRWLNGNISWVSLEQEIEMGLPRLISIAKKGWPRLT